MVANGGGVIADCWCRNGDCWCANGDCRWTLVGTVGGVWATIGDDCWWRNDWWRMQGDWRCTGDGRWFMNVDRWCVNGVGAWTAIADVTMIFVGVGVALVGGRLTVAE